MRKKQVALAAVLAGGALFGLQAVLDSNEPDAPAEPSAANAAQAQDQRLAEIEAERDRLATDLAAAAAERDALADQLAAEETAGAAEAEAEIARLTADLARQAEEIERLKADLAARDVELAAFVAAAKILPLPGEEEKLVAIEALPILTLDAGPAETGAAAPRAASPRAAAAPAVAAASMAAGAPIAEVLFERGSASLSAGAAVVAAEAAAALAALGPARIRVTGHSDTTGRAEWNLRLSQERADAVVAALVAAGVPRDRIDVEAHGQASAALPIPTGPGVSEPLNRSVAIHPVVLQAAASPAEAAL